MQYSRLGNTGLIVSKFAFGSMTFGKPPEGAFGEEHGSLGHIYKVDQATANDLVAQAIDAGVNFFDTADVYANGQSELMLGKALGNRRQEVVITTKVGNRLSNTMIDQGLSRQHIYASVHASLKRLNTDYIDVYMVHRLDRHTPIEETLETLDALVRQGLVRYIGFSNWPTWLAAKSVGLQHEHNWAQFRAAEMYYSLLGRDMEHEMIPFVEDAGIGMMLWSPLAGGFLSGKYTRENPDGNGGRLTGFNIVPVDREQGYNVVEKLREIGEQHNASPAQVALAWLLSRPFVTSILLGIANTSQLQDNLGAASLELSADEIATLDALTKPQALYPGWLNAYLFDEQVRNALAQK